ncbi:unnamed protein product, partial [Mesorhabditis belari]|uniref:Uncharacterized protein n=1 Tax=Mesorhabditis belari TaxID=2138241 RepID=A0AAF3J2M2_9BILA
MDNFLKSLDHLTETVSASACRPHELRHLAKNNDTSLNREAAEDISKRHLKAFLERVDEEVRELCRHQELEKRFDDLERLDEKCAAKYGRDSKGYRPVGDPNVDTDGLLSKTKIEYKKNLEKYIVELDEQIQDNSQVLDNNSMVMKKLYEAVREHYSTNDSLMSTKLDAE